MKLKQQHDSSMHYLGGVRERLRAAETKQKHMIVFMIKSLKNPVFLQHCIDRMKKRRALAGRVLKRRRLASEDCSMMDDSIKTIASIDEENPEVNQELMIESEVQPLFSDGSGSSSQDTTRDVCSENFVLWEKLMEDDMIYEEAASKEHSDIVLELENLIAKPELPVSSAST